jgi:nicotinamide-nucleotide amidase
LNKKLEIICVGKELLMGKIPNINAHWLAKRATTLGLEVDRIVTVTDNVEVIASAVQEALQRRPRFLITTGGLGPTYDDKTLEGIAKGTGRSLEFNEQALKKIMERMRDHTQGRESEFGEEALRRIRQAVGDFERGVYSPYMSKYATIPKGSSVVLPPDIHSGGLGIICELEGTTLITLPGVPEEVNAIVEQWIVPLFKEAAGNVAFFEASLDVKGIWERVLAPFIDKVMAENPRVYVKSNVRSDVIREGLELYLSTTDEDPKIAENNLNKALSEISELIRQNSGKITPIKSIMQQP